MKEPCRRGNVSALFVIHMDLISAFDAPRSFKVSAYVGHSAKFMEKGMILVNSYFCIKFVE